MKTIVIYPIPLDNWTVFNPFVERFTRTFREFPPGEDCEVWGMCYMALPNVEVRQLFDGISTKFVPYYHDTKDGSGSHQFASWLMEENIFMVGMTSRCYFHRAGWLTKLVEARRQYGPGLYGLCANRGSHPLHICCRCYAMDSDDYKDYPYVLNTRSAGFAFETGDGIPDGPAHVWMQKRGKAAKVVMWDGAYGEADWFTPANRFWNGDQSNMLVFDKHTDGYRDAGPEERARLEACQLA